MSAAYSSVRVYPPVANGSVEVLGVVLDRRSEANGGGRRRIGGERTPIGITGLCHRVARRPGRWCCGRSSSSAALSTLVGICRTWSDTPTLERGPTDSNEGPASGDCHGVDGSSVSHDPPGALSDSSGPSPRHRRSSRQPHPPASSPGSRSSAGGVTAASSAWALAASTSVSRVEIE